MRTSKAVLAAGTVVFGAAIPVLYAAPAHAAEKPDIVFTAAFDRAEAKVGDTVTLSAKVSNKGSVAAEGVHFSAGGPETNWVVVCQNADDLKAEFSLAPGAAKDFTWTCTVPQGAAQNTRASFFLRADARNGEASVGDNTAIAHVSVPGAAGSISGVMHVRLDPPQQGPSYVNGARIELLDLSGKVISETTTNVGQYTFAKVKPGKYKLKPYPPAGAYFPGEVADVEVFADKNTEVTIALKRVASTPSTTPSPSSSVVPVTGANVPPAKGSPTGTELPVTGTNAMVIGGVAVALMGAGAAFVVAARRRRYSTSV